MFLRALHPGCSPVVDTPDIQTDCDYRPILDTDMEISEPMAEEFVQVAVPVFNQLVSSVRDLILVRDVISSLKVCHSHLSAIQCAADVISCY